MLIKLPARVTNKAALAIDMMPRLPKMPKMPKMPRLPKQIQLLLATVIGILANDSTVNYVNMPSTANTLVHFLICYSSYIHISKISLLKILASQSNNFVLALIPWMVAKRTFHCDHTYQGAKASTVILCYSC